MTVELNEAYDKYGDITTDRILQRANSMYRTTMVASGIDPFIRKYGNKKAQDEIISQQFDRVDGWENLKTNIDEYWMNILRNIWLFCFRLSHSWAWMLWVFPFLLAIVYDGIQSRKTKMATFQYTSPTIYNLSWHAIIFIVSMMALLYAVAWPLHILSYPVVLVLIGLNIRVLISNIQHSA